MPSADIIAFPNRAEERLRTALAALDAALADQRAAVAEFRDNIGALGGAVAGLEDSLRRYSTELTTAQADVLATHAQARQLEATAEGWLRRFGAPAAL